MPIKIGGFAQSKMDGAEEPNMEEVLSNDSINGTDQSEVVVDKYSGEEFEIERNSDFITSEIYKVCKLSIGIKDRLSTHCI